MNFPVPILLPNCTCDNPRETTGLPTGTHGLTHGSPREQTTNHGIIKIVRVSNDH